jgi:3'-phosphoadenosine 5'-phosphosulfate sulfotransferase (PAPS reductase)/FAD synthetase
MKNVLLYGAGTQSTGLLLMMLDGYIDIKPDLVIFSDTFSEPKFVYEYMNKVIDYVDKLGVDIIIVHHRNLESEIFEKYKKGERVASLPLFSSNGGMIMRQCTGDYKINPVNRYIRYKYCIKRRRKDSNPVVNRFFGMSLDEIERCKTSTDWFAINEYPLVLNRTYRHEVINYINEKHPELKNPPRSSCYFCPFHSNDYWRLLKEKHPDEFEKAVIIDEEIREKPGLDNKHYLHRSLKPLKDIDFKKTQYEIFAECEGYCGM